MKTSLLLSLATGILLTGMSSLHAQLTWDPDGVNPGVQNGAGAWNLTNTNWWNGAANTTWDNSGSTIAAFGSTASKTGGTVTVEGTMKLGGIRFNNFSTSAAADLPVTSAYTITGGTLQFADNAIIEAANNSSSGSTTALFLNLNSILVGNGLTLQRVDETRINAFQYIRFAAANPNLTGVLNINARANNNGIFLLLAASNNVSSMSNIVVQNGSVLATGGTNNTYAMPISIAGNGQGNGAIRVDSSGIRYTGEITLTEDAAILTNRGVLTTFIDSPITDGTAGAGFGFQRFASANNSILTLGGTSTYRGATTIGRTGSTSAGTTVLNFASSAAPVADMLYHGVTTAGTLNLQGGTTGAAAFIIQGKDSTANSQRFGNVAVSGTRSNVILSPGADGSMTLSLGTITRTSPASVTFTSDVPGAITTTTPDGFLGPWSALVNKAGYGSWVNVSGGKLTAFSGTTTYTGTALSGLGATSDVSITSATTGNVTGGAGTYQVSTISMNDSTASRTIDIGAGNVLRLGTTGGIQLTRDAQSLDVGVPGSAGFLRAGTTTGQMWLTNLSKSGVLTINSVIENNGANALAVYLNGLGKTVLTGANTYTGVTQIGSGVVDIAHSTALGTIAGNTTVLNDATLRLSGGISVAEPLVINGLGLNGQGVLVNASGNNEITGVTTVSQPVRINSESGTLLFKATNGITDIINSSGSGATVVFGGSGDITIQGRINAAGNIISKDGAGTLTFAGSQTFTGALNPTAGTVHLDFSSSYSPTTNILYNGVTAAALTLNATSLKLTGLSAVTNSQTFGALTLSNQSNINLNTNGATSLAVNFGAITRNLGSVLSLDIPSGSSVGVNAGSNNALLTANGRPYAYIRDSVNGDEWAGTGVLANSVRPIVKLSTLSGAAGYTNSTATTLAGNANIAAGITTTTLAASTTVDSLRFAQPQSTLITDGGASTTLTVGGILVSSTVGANTTTISAGTLRGSAATTTTSPDLNIIQNNTAGSLVITGGISNALSNTSVATTSYINKSGPGLLVLGGTNTFSGSMRIYEGAVQLASDSMATTVEFLLGSGASSGKLILGQGTTAINDSSYDYIQTVGSGTDNRIVGGSSAMSRLTLTGSVSVASTFSTGFIGGSGTFENNLELRLASLDSLLTLGPANSYIGRTVLSRGTLQVEKLANIGEVSSLGTGSFNSAAGTITLSDATTSAVGSNATSVIRYVGSTDSTTNRPLNITNSDEARDIASVVAVLENIGTGTLKFTAPFQVGGTNVSDRVLRLTGTNTGLNEIVSIGDVSTSIVSRIEKTGTGTWALTGNSTYTGETTVSQGALLANNPLTGSATGRGNVRVTAGGTLGGTGRIAPAANNSVIISGGVLNPGLPGTLLAVGKLTLETSGTGLLTLENSGSIVFDLFSGAGLGNNTAIASSADQLAITGGIALGSGSSLRILNPSGMTAWAAGDQWKLFDWNGLTPTVTGAFDNYDLPDLPEGLLWNTNDLFTSGILSITAAVVPEPGRLSLLGLAFAGLLFRRRR